jgi:hypothetical protein
VTAVRKLFLDGIDVGLWADRRTLKNVVRTIRDVDNFELKFNKKNRLGTAFPVALVGGIQVYYGFWDSANHANDYELFSGRLLFYEWGTEKSSVRGKLRCQFVTPLQELKRIMEYVAFDPLVQDTDDKRVRRLFELADLPNWDYTTGTTTTPSITYPSGAGFEPLTSRPIRAGRATRATPCTVDAGGSQGGSRHPPRPRRVLHGWSTTATRSRPLRARRS